MCVCVRVCVCACACVCVLYLCARSIARIASSGLKCNWFAPVPHKLRIPRHMVHDLIPRQSRHLCRDGIQEQQQAIVHVVLHVLGGTETPLLKWKSGDLLAQFFGCSLYDALWRGNPMIDVALGNGLVFFEENGPSKKIDFNLWLYDEIMLNPWVCCFKSRYSSPVS